MRDDEVVFIIDEEEILDSGFNPEGAIDNAAPSAESEDINVFDVAENSESRKSFITRIPKRYIITVGLIVCVAVVLLVHFIINNKDVPVFYFYEDDTLYRIVDNKAPQKVIDKKMPCDVTVYTGKDINNTYLTISYYDSYAPSMGLNGESDDSINRNGIYYLSPTGELTYMADCNITSATYYGERLYIYGNTDSMGYNYNLYEAKDGELIELANDIGHSSIRTDGKGFSYINGARELFRVSGNLTEKIASDVLSCYSAPYSQGVFFVTRNKSDVEMFDLYFSPEGDETKFIASDENFNYVDVLADGESAFIRLDNGLCYYDNRNYMSIYEVDINSFEALIYGVDYKLLNRDKNGIGISGDITYISNGSVYYYKDGEKAMLYSYSKYMADYDPYDYPYNKLSSTYYYFNYCVDTNSKKFYCIESNKLISGDISMDDNTQTEFIANNVLQVLTGEVNGTEVVYGYIDNSEIVTLLDDKNKVIKEFDNKRIFDYLVVRDGIVFSTRQESSDLQVTETNYCLYYCEKGKEPVLIAEDILDSNNLLVGEVQWSKVRTKYYYFTTVSQKDPDKIMLCATDGKNVIVMSEDFSQNASAYNVYY